LSADALNHLFDTLPIVDEEWIAIDRNPGTGDCDINIAMKKGWQTCCGYLLPIIRATEPNQMIMTFGYQIWNNRKVTLMIAGTGTATIEWGDDETETHTLNKSLTSYSHCYSDKARLRLIKKNIKISITGENITHLRCNGNYMNNLDVSKNPTLTWLDCSENNISTLGLRNNIALTSLYCWSNELSWLDVTANTALKELDCSYNNLIHLDLSKNTLLMKLDCSENRLFASELNNLFGKEVRDFNIDIENNPGTTQVVAERKWIRTSANKDRKELEERLRYLAQTNYSGKISSSHIESLISWCPSKNFCSICGFSEIEYHNGEVKKVYEIEIVVKKIRKNLGYDVVLDKREFCPRCSKREIGIPELIFSIRFCVNSNYHVVRTNDFHEYACLLAFLEGKETYIVDCAESYYEKSLHESVGIIKFMTGLGADLDLPYNHTSKDPLYESIIENFRKRRRRRWKKLKLKNKNQYYSY